MTEEQLTPPPVIGLISNWDGVFSFFLTQLAYTLKELNDRYKEIKVYGDIIKDEYFVKCLKTAVVYTLYLVVLKKSVTFTDREVLNRMEQELTDLLEKKLVNVTNTIDLKTALDIWKKILEYTSKISYGVRVVTEEEMKEKERYPKFMLE